MTILFIRGINDKNKVTPYLTKGGALSFSFDGSSSIYYHMGYDKQTASTLILFPSRTSQPKIRLKQTPSLIFNEISDPDSHHDTLERCATVCNQLKVPVINHPEKILHTTRDNVARRLDGIPGVHMPRTIRFRPRSPEDIFTKIDEAGFVFPVIVRIAGVHGGESNVFLESRDDLHKLHVYPFDSSWFYLTQFIDYRSDDGLYRKYRIIVVDRNPLLRHLLIDSKWMIHASSRNYMQNKTQLWIEEQKRYDSFELELKPVIAPAIQEIARRLGLDYFGIDCNINEQGEMLIFEANANMNVLYNNYDSLKGRIELIKQHINQLIMRKNSPHGN